MKQNFFYLVCFYLVTLACGESHDKHGNLPAATRDSSSTYAYDRDFLKKYTPLIELQKNAAKVVIVPAYQGRVMTSSCSGDSGYSFGWINYDLVASNKLKDHINPYGGEERLWLAPEGGQFAFFFKKNTPYDFEHWFTPKEFDTEPFAITSQTDTSVIFNEDMVLTNRSGTIFNIHIERKISLLDNKEIEQHLNTAIGKDIQVVAYESKNTLNNTGKNAWTKKTGAAAIWLLGMLKPTPYTTVVLPLREGKGDTTKLVNDQYFGAIPGDRWKIGEGHAYLKSDGKYRGKVGIPPQHATKYIGSYDAHNKILSLIECEWSPGQKDFVNSAWEDQKKPFSGDAFNAYNDGPLKDGSQLGPFYEIESLSPAAFLLPGEGLTHTQITYHFQGDQNGLDKIARQTLGVGLAEIEKVFHQ